MIRLLLVSLVPAAAIRAQDSSRALSFSGYAEVYYQFDFNQPGDGNRPGFVYSHNRHNEFNLNLGVAKVSYTRERVRANLALGAGTYTNANYAAEPAVLKNIMEANAGIRISKKKELWIDAGIMPSHIGFESAISKDCWTLTRSILADNSPYFQSGAKLSYTSGNSKWLLSVLALNGWQRITRVKGNSLMSWGTQLQYKPSPKTLFNYSTFIGTDKPDSARQLRFFHNCYGIFSLTDKLGLILGLDIGMEERQGEGSNTWYATAAILRYSFTDKWAMAARGEYYNDKNSVIISSISPNRFRTSGFSLNIDHSPFKNALLRMEIKNLGSKDAILLSGSGRVKSNTAIVTSLSVAL